MSTTKARTIALTGSIAAITATGAWYGAGLKTQQEFKQERQIANQATPQSRLSQLETQKLRLLRQRAELQSKIDRLAGKPDHDDVDDNDGVSQNLEARGR